MRRREGGEEGGREVRRREGGEEEGGEGGREVRRREGGRMRKGLYTTIANYLTTLT